MTKSVLESRPIVNTIGLLVIGSTHVTNLFPGGTGNADIKLFIRAEPCAMRAVSIVKLSSDSTTNIGYSTERVPQKLELMTLALKYKQPFSIKSPLNLIQTVCQLQLNMRVSTLKQSVGDALGLSYQAERLVQPFIYSRLASFHYPHD